MSLLDQTVASVVAQDSGWRERARARLEQLVMPHWALGRLMDLAEDLAGMTRSLSPHFARRTIVVMAGDHGVAEEGVSLYPQEVTQQMVRSIAVGGASINHLAKVGGADLVVVDMGVSGDLTQLVDSGKVVSYNVGKGTGNIARGPAMTRDQAVQSLEHGIRIAREYGEATDLFGTGDMGIGNTTPSAAIAAAITQCSPEVVTGRGTGIDDIRLKEKALVVSRAIDVNNPDRTDPVDVLAKVGGFEIGGIAGLILGAASLSRPVVVDGFISTAGALLAVELAPAARDYIVAGHRSAEHGHDVMLARLGKRPLLDLEMCLGEGTGAALAMPLVEAAGGLLSRVMTFEEASVSDRTE